jgi:flagellar basal body-associated protein FliL
MPAGKFTIYKFLRAVLVVLLAVIMAGTIIAFVSKKAALQVPNVPNVPNGTGAAVPQPPIPPASAAGASSIKTFSGIGRLRAPLKPDSPAKQGQQSGETIPATVVIEPYFSYNSADRAFSEELAAHIRDFRTATLDYYISLPASSPILNNDEAMKTELLNRYNSVLHLGKITALYFTNFMIID